MDKNHGRQQTTKGIWLSQAGKTLIFDIEGTDSKERAKDGKGLSFEQTTSLFALAMADVLLINMWYTDIGRDKGSNYGLLKVIFEANLKLFDQQSSKKLLFVLRDYDNESNEKAIKDNIHADLETIWGEIYKPESHKKFQSEQFNQKCYELKGRFV